MRWISFSTPKYSLHSVGLWFTWNDGGQYESWRWNHFLGWKGLDICWVVNSFFTSKVLLQWHIQIPLLTQVVKSNTLQNDFALVGSSVSLCSTWNLRFSWPVPLSTRDLGGLCPLQRKWIIIICTKIFYIRIRNPTKSLSTVKIMENLNGIEYKLRIIRFLLPSA